MYFTCTSLWCKHKVSSDYEQRTETITTITTNVFAGILPLGLFSIWKFYHLCNFKTIEDIFIKLDGNIKYHLTICRNKNCNSIYIFCCKCFSLKFLEYTVCSLSIILKQWKTLSRHWEQIWWSEDKNLNSTFLFDDGFRRTADIRICFCFRSKHLVFWWSVSFYCHNAIKM